MHPSIAVEACFNARVLSVSELARRCGMTTATLRFYERKGLLTPAGRAGQVRVYDDSAVDRVATVSLLRQAGFTLAEIGELIRPGAAMGQRTAMVHAKLTQLERARADIDRAEAMLRHALECPDPDISVCPVLLREVRAHAERMARGLDPGQAG
jgi:DNA-binding transcriptional MerR regulator